MGRDSGTAVEADRSGELHHGIALELAYDALLRRVLRVLVGAGIPVMPLKGVLLAYWLYEAPAERLGGDIDLLVPPQHFPKAVSLLAREGLGDWFYSPSGHECTFQGSRPAIQIDLHRSLFGRGRFRLSTREVFARGREDRTLYSEQVILPDPYDVYAHLIGHAASDHVARLPARTRKDLALLAERLKLDPRACAAHLDAHGLGRAARYVYGVSDRADSFGREVEAALRPDPLGERLARVAGSITARFPQMSIFSRAAGFLANSSVPQSAIALLFVLTNRLRLRLGWTPR